MRDPLDDLKSLPGAARPPLPPAEVRRRGDRLRRRRTAFQAVGAVAAVAAIASGGALVTGGHTNTLPTPPATQLPRPERGSVTEVPARLEGAIEVSLPGGPLKDAGLDVLWKALPCGNQEEGDTRAARTARAKPWEALGSTWLAGIDDRRTDQVLQMVFPAGEFHTRQLVVYPDDRTATEAMAAIREQSRTCESVSSPDGAGEPDWAVQHRSLGAEDGLLVVGTEPTGAARTLLTVVRRGNAVLVSSRSEEMPSPIQELADAGAAALLDSTRQLAARMCVFAVEGCDDDDTAGFVQDVPAGFPVDRGLPAAGGDVPEWTWSTDGTSPLSPVACGEEQPPPEKPLSDLRVQVDPPDERAWRHVLVFADTAAATAVLERARQEVARCEGETDVHSGPAEMRWSIEESARGSAVVLQIRGQAYAEGTEQRVPGRVLARVAQVSNVVLLARHDDASSASGDDAVSHAFDSDTDVITTRMCRLAGLPCP